jgi:hypothetical protein
LTSIYELVIETRQGVDDFRSAEVSQIQTWYSTDKAAMAGWPRSQIWMACGMWSPGAINRGLFMDLEDAGAGCLEVLVVYGCTNPRHHHGLEPMLRDWVCNWKLLSVLQRPAMK